MMTTQERMQDNSALPYEGDGGVYLLVADDSTEFDAALRRVSYLAKQNKGRAAVLYVIEDEAFLHWNFIEKQIQSDKRTEAEKTLWKAGQKLYDMSGLMPGFYIREGKTREEVSKVLNTDPTIRALVLGASPSSSNPLISHFTGKGLAELHVPLVIVPENA